MSYKDVIADLLPKGLITDDPTSLAAKYFSALGTPLDDLDLKIEDVRAQFFPQTATWGIKYWEDLLGLPIATDQNIEKRRTSVLGKLVISDKTNWAGMLAIIHGFGLEGTISENFAGYSFEVTVTNPHDVSFDVDQFEAALNAFKPAHLAMTIVYDWSKWQNLEAYTYAELEAYTYAELEAL